MESRSDADPTVDGNGASASDPTPGPVLLHVDSSPRATSATRTLTAAYVAAWREHHPDGTVRVHDLPALNPPHLNATEMGAWLVRALPADREVRQPA